MGVVASTPFCGLSDVAHVGLPSSALGVLSATQQQACVDSANGIVGSKLAGRYPGINANQGAGWTWDSGVVLWAVQIAQKLMLDTRGRSAAAGTTDETIEKRYAQAIEFLDMVQRQAMHPNITPLETAGATSQGPALISYSQLGTNSNCVGANRGI